MIFGVNQLDDSNRTPLMFAALGNNRRSSCSTLIDCGVKSNVNLKDIYGLTALHVVTMVTNQLQVFSLSQEQHYRYSECQSISMKLIEVVFAAAILFILVSLHA